MEGIIVVNKPDGITSHDVVARVRKKFKIKRVGHAGTLDPLATGVLVILVGKATKLFSKFVAFDKAYRATLILGTATTSADIEGKIIEQKSYDHIERKQVEDVFQGFVGDIEQVPPMVSAVKMAGRKLYQLARKGIEVERKARRIRIDCLNIEEFSPPEVKFYLECSKGTYVRQLAEDAGKALGCGACISQIQRTKVGVFSIEEAVNIEDLNESHIRNWQG
ncbi:MAG: tRNA pseudouridine(55) synthase TruB [Candidatus Omnitrophica bacterium]|nr:tRNA pseudouridine(55) synthase TruB [Candidatus Omnitrophota bacterium]MCK5260302.1 tRNA pseudouridine(55) synthase TruB [Candidatus Omnitrophota bacterium]